MAREEKIKCLIFDLDGTLWEGILSEGGECTLREGIKELIEELDRRGIIMSIASKNDPAPAEKRLRELGVWEYFLLPHISWGPKSQSVSEIIDGLSIKAGSVAFIDDNVFERDEVSYALPDVRVYDANESARLASYPEFNPVFITEDAKNRRNMYRADMARKADEQSYGGSSEEFLMTLGMKLKISPVNESDLQRVHELTIRTHQLNSTGFTYSFEELRELISSEDHVFLVASLSDRYGDSGKVGLMLMEKGEQGYILKLLIVSCRVMSRGIGTALLIHGAHLASEAGKPLYAMFRETEHNRIMYITYKMMGFEEIEENGDDLLLAFSSEDLPEYPPYLDIEL